jgi:hypothetical protein
MLKDTIVVAVVGPLGPAHVAHAEEYDAQRESRKG